MPILHGQQPWSSGCLGGSLRGAIGRLPAPLARHSLLSRTTRPPRIFAAREMASDSRDGDRSWDEVLKVLSSLITFKSRADGKGWRDAFEHMPVYLQVCSVEPQQPRCRFCYTAA